MVPTISLSRTLPLALTWGCTHGHEGQQAEGPLSCPQTVAGAGGVVGAHQQVDRLYDVDEDLILLVLDALGAPGHSIGDGGRHP